MKFTDKELYLEKKLVEKLDLMCERCTKRKFDNLIIIEGQEGYGKSTLAVTIAYYCAWKTGRKFDINNVFFKPDDMLNFALKGQDEIVLWDEAALAGLASDWQRKVQRKLIKMLMIARKKRHIYIFCIPKFFKLNEYIIDRAIGMIRVYARRETELGRFVYFTKKSLRTLMDIWRASKKLLYKKNSSFHGDFKNYLKKIIDEVEYDKKKDAAIESLLYEEEKEMDKQRKELIKLQWRIGKLKPLEIKTKEELAKWLGLGTTTLVNWQNLDKKYPFVLEKWAVNSKLPAN